jgi:hypothetical protein
MTARAVSALLSHGKGLRRVAGVDISYGPLEVDGAFLDPTRQSNCSEETIVRVIRGCPDLQETGIIGTVLVSVLPGGYLGYTCLISPHRHMIESSFNCCDS